MAHPKEPTHVVPRGSISSKARRRFLVRSRRTTAEYLNQPLGYDLVFARLEHERIHFESDLGPSKNNRGLSLSQRVGHFMWRQRNPAWVPIDLHRGDVIGVDGDEIRGADAFDLND